VPARPSPTPRTGWLTRQSFGEGSVPTASEGPLLAKTFTRPTHENEIFKMCHCAGAAATSKRDGFSDANRLPALNFGCFFDQPR
jgi:hypothetical protein